MPDCVETVSREGGGIKCVDGGGILIDPVCSAAHSPSLWRTGGLSIMSSVVVSMGGVGVMVFGQTADCVDFL
jgi:hypothetical protein